MKKPGDLAFGVDDTPPRSVALGTALQHIGVFGFAVIFPLAVCQAAGASASTAADVISLGLIIAGAATILQALPRGGSGYLAPTGFHGIYLGPSLLAASSGGLPLVFGMTVFAGAVEAVISRAWYRLRPFMPPELSGLVILLIGLSVVPLGLRDLVAPAGGRPAGTATWAVAGLTLALMVGLNVWSRGYARMFCTLIGTLVGSAAAKLAGLWDAQAVAGVADRGLFEIPGMSHVGWSFEPALVAPFAIAAIAAAANTSANITVYQKLTDAEWVRPDLNSISRGTLADGAAAAASGLAGSFGVATLASSAGIVAATGVASRRIAYTLGALTVALAFFPPFTTAMIGTPAPVVSADILFAAVFILISGMQIITSRMLDARKSIVIGLALSAALAVQIFPAAVTAAPQWLQPLLGSPLVTGTFVAIGLNTLFRIGVRQTVRLTLDAQGDYRQAIDDFFTRHGKTWGARPEIARRAAFGATQLAEALYDAGLPEGAPELEASFDEYNLDVRVTYRGALLALPETRPTDAEIRDTDDGMQRLAGYLLRRNADRVHAAARDGRATVEFHFDH